MSGYGTTATVSGTTVTSIFLSGARSGTTATAIGIGGSGTDTDSFGITDPLGAGLGSDSTGTGVASPGLGPGSRPGFQTFSSN